MNSFIVMQGETYHEERNAGILWTPRIDKSGMVPHSWKRMHELKEGDHVFHYVKGQIVAISLITQGCKNSIIPGGTEEVFIAQAVYHELDFPLAVRDYFDAIEPLLPLKYSPFQEDASGNSGYLYPCNEELAMKLLEVITSLNFFAVEEEQLELAIEVVKRSTHNPLMTMISEMEMEIKEKMRRSKKQFSKSLMQLWHNECPLCGIAIDAALAASYAKPWKDSTDAERLDPHNGILLCANHAALFTSGLISFTGGGQLHIASRIPEAQYAVYGLKKAAKVPATLEHAPYFRWHKRNIYIEPKKLKLAKTMEER
ncbi:hypothetical protein HNQ44_002696 [Planomicrobium koreense]|uniref:HNH nuclease domain-containing protein n=1 Tax=Planococcus koreensis TaxID=112331 RepID=A0A7W8CTV9_9BACL|nr:HNH endonuclease signature motif containing protein [Planococcus koreensis]MBB5181231.1 hypothetical protein [Planococcus koreensis]